MIRADFYLELLTQINKIFFAKKTAPKIIPELFLLLRFHIRPARLRKNYGVSPPSCCPHLLPQYCHVINPRPEFFYSPGRILL